MHFMEKTVGFSGWRSKSPRLLFILGFLCIYLIGLAALTPRASAATLSIPGGDVSDPVVRQVDIAQPAVVRIITTITGSLAVRFTPTSDPVTFPLSGGTYPIQLSGTGAFISSHGEILTADHVVNPPHDQELDQALYETAAQDIADYINTHLQPSQPFSPDDVVAALEAGEFSSTTAYGQPSSEVFLSTAYTGSINAASLNGVPAKDHATVDRIEAQSSFDAMDVAIVHVSGMDDMPSIQLDNSNQVQDLDNLTIIGYPGNGDLSNSPTDLLTSSVNKIYVSAIKTTDAGAPVIEVGGNVEHGDSGAPALDSNGNVVGIVSFGLSDANDIGLTTFLQASNSAETLIRSQGINTAPGPFEKAWSQAIDDYSSAVPGHWHKALQELQSLANNYTNFQGVTPYLTYAQSQAGHEQVPSTTGSTGASAALIVVLILLLLVILCAVLFVLLRRRVQPVVATPYAMATMGTYPQQPGGSFGAYSSLPPGYIPQTPANHTAASQYELAAQQVPQTPPLTVSAAPLSQPSKEAEPAYANGSGLAMPPANWPFASESSAAAQPVEQAKPFERGLPTWAPPEAVAQAPEPTPLAQQVPAQPASVTPTEGQEESGAQARTFSVPRRPSLPLTDSSTTNQQIWVAPCGHVNTLNVRFCRVCGQSISPTDSQDLTDMSRLSGL